MTRRAVVIGARGGIGSACMAAFVAAGWQVLGADREGGNGVAGLDVTDPDAVAAYADSTGAVDAMVYAAGAVATMPIADTDFARWRQLMAVNLDGAAHAASAFSRAMIARGEGGAMVFLSSVAGLRGEANASAYCASKAGLRGLVEAIASELAVHNIRVNSVAPGNVNTPMLREVAVGIARATGRDVGSVWEDLAHTGAANRIIDPAEIARVCVAMCEPGFSAVTGATLPVDAGYLLA